jgi:hypothetical protein
VISVVEVCSGHMTLRTAGKDGFVVCCFDDA